MRPDFVLLCASGKINDAAKQFIMDTVQDKRIRFLDVNDLIPELDVHYPELWYGIDAEILPYLKNLRDSLLKSVDTIALSDIGLNSNSIAPITEDQFIPLSMYRLTAEIKKSHGQYHRIPKFEEKPVQAILTHKDTLCVLVGDGGTGKTTAIRRLAFNLAEKAINSSKVDLIPVILKSLELTTTRSRLLDTAAQTTVSLSNNGKTAFSSKDLEDGKVVLFIDALDEVPLEEDRAYVISEIVEFHSVYPQCRIVVTSRDIRFLSTYAPLQAFEEFRLKPIHFRQAEKLIHKLVQGRKLSAENTHEMLRKLQEVHGLELNPMLITIFVAISDSARRDIPANITELFKKFTELMLGRWDQRKGLSQQYQAPLKDFLLKSFAFMLHNSKRTACSLEECGELMRRELRDRDCEGDYSQLFDEIILRSNLLRVDGDEVRFSHFLLQEFFAGRGIPSAEFLKSAACDEWWRKAIVFYFGEHPAAHEDILNLISSLKQANGRDLYFAAIAIGLAIQACYLSKVSEKGAMLEWVVCALSQSQTDYTDFLQKNTPQLPIHSFLNYYLYARESVACSLIRQVAEKEARHQRDRADPMAEARLFWSIVGLIESGQTECAEQLLRDFRPEDNMLLLALHLGATLTTTMRISTKEEKDAAKRICETLGPRVETQIKELKKELMGVLLEVRQGRIAVLDRPPAE